MPKKSSTPAELLVAPRLVPFFDTLMKHFDAVEASSKSRHRNMYVRATTSAKGSGNNKKNLSYLHAIRDAGSGVIEGMASGPGFSISYSLTRSDIVHRSIQSLNMRTHNDFFKKFEDTVLKRVAMESTWLSASTRWQPKRSEGALYLCRCKGGSEGPDYEEALRTGLLDPSFVNELASWDLKVLVGKKRR